MTNPLEAARSGDGVELLPCPFCNGEAKRVTLGPDDGAENDGGDVIVCTGVCGCSSHVEFGYKENLVSLWNTRATVAESAPWADAAITERDASNEALVCTGCGTTRTVEHIRYISPGALSCCPERKMVPVREAIRVAEVQSDLDWLAGHKRLSLQYYSPWYGDDDDQSEEWRVDRESGPINDREWETVGRGDTPAAAIAAARAALTASEGERG